MFLRTRRGCAIRVKGTSLPTVADGSDGATSSTETDIEPQAVVVNDYGAFVMMPRMVLQSEVSNTAKLVYLHLWDHSQGGKGNIYPRHKTLAERMGASVSSVKRWLKELQDAGFIAIEKRNRPDGSLASNSYRILMNRGGFTGEPGGGFTGEPGMKQTQKEPSTKRANLLPASWSPTAEHIERALADGLDLDREVQKFRAHAEEHERKAVSWNGAFTRWLITAAEIAKSRWSPSTRSPKTDTQRVLDILDIDMTSTSLEDELRKRIT